MRPTVRYTAMVALACAASAAGQTVTVTLNSPQNGQTVNPGDTINWSILFSVSTAGNAGLALLSVDLTQDASNPERFDIPPADSVPSGMTNFARPAGICNPQDVPPASPHPAYVGLQRGAAGRKNLVQIGGAQNTFGQATAPGSGVAENANVVAGVGHSGPTLLASGSFTAPSTPGTYTYRLATGIANVMTTANSPPLISPAVSATVDLTGGVISFNVLPCEACDANCDGVANGLDIQAFVMRVVGFPHTPCSTCAGDMDNSGGVTVADVPAFVNCLLTE